MDTSAIDLSSGAAGDDLAEMRELLVATGYTTEGIRALAQIDDPVKDILANRGRYSFFYEENLAKLDAPAAVVGQLFLFGRPVPASRLELLPRRLCDLLQARRFLATTARNEITARVAITEFRGRYFLSDVLFEYVAGAFVPLSSAPCMPPHASSLELADELETLPPAGSLLDVGCGSGVQSILFAHRYQRLAGLDLDPKSVDFARANATLNRADVRYVVADCTSYRDEAPYEHVSVNIPAEVTLAFLETGLEPVLAPGGLCKMWASFEVAASERTLQGLLEKRLSTYSRYHVVIEEKPQSPFALSRAQLQRGLMPRSTLLVDHPSQWPGYIGRLRAKRIVEVTTAILTITRK